MNEIAAAYVYSALALHAAGRELNEENLRKFLEGAGLEINEPIVNAISTLIATFNVQKDTEIQKVKEDLTGGQASALDLGLKQLEERLARLEGLIRTQFGDISRRLLSIEEGDRIPREENLGEVATQTISSSVEVEGDSARFPATPTVSFEGCRAEEARNVETEVPASSRDVNAGRYLYCVIEGREQTSFGKIGIDENEVYTVPYRDICAVVHNCPPEPYKSEDAETVKGWVTKHNDVVDYASRRSCSVLPLGFDTIIKGSDSLSADGNLKKWLEEDYEKLQDKLVRFRDKVEVGVQIFWDPKIMAQQVTDTSEEIRLLKEEMKTKPKGMAYFYEQKLQGALKKKMEKKADEYFKDFYERIKKHACDIRVEKAKREKNMQMLMNLSVLIENDKLETLGRELGEIKETQGFSVRFTGPWPPYTFASGN